MKDALLEELETKVITKAIKLLDVDKLADSLAKQLTKKITDNIDEIIDNRLDISDWIFDEMVNENTKIGKEFKKAMNKIAKRMTDAI